SRGMTYDPEAWRLQVQHRGLGSTFTPTQVVGNYPGGGRTPVTKVICDHILHFAETKPEPIEGRGASGIAEILAAIDHDYAEIILAFYTDIQRRLGGDYEMWAECQSASKICTPKHTQDFDADNSDARKRIDAARAKDVGNAAPAPRL
ncbi:hypothetical protein HF263_23085, partial [Rhizobium leguminosarum]|nr:hypothetical protein [Rhizobium leguminosarum]MBY3058940.1 hypothetical protein [Rhizobium leguminosarum]